MEAQPATPVGKQRMPPLDCLLLDAENGYYPEERLVIIPEGKEEGRRYIVVEGNRRLAAVRLLVDAETRDQIGAALPSISPNLADDLRELPISIYKDRQTLWSYLGFRHINRIKPWDAWSVNCCMCKTERRTPFLPSERSS